MRFFSNENKKRDIISTAKSESFNTTEFTEYDSNDSFYHSIEELFYPESGSAIEFITDQERNTTASFVHFQIPYENRSGGIYPSSFTIESGSLKIIDDGDGNLIDANDPAEPNVGNIFYNSGNIFITSSGSFHDTATDYKEIKDLNPTLTYQRETYFIHNKYYIDINADDYTYSTNPTFKDSDAPHPFITTVYLYNDKNEKIGVAKLSKPVSTENDIFLILDDLETI